MLLFGSPRVRKLSSIAVMNNGSFKQEIVSSSNEATMSLSDA